MAAIYTYSFADTTLTINHPSYGSYSAYGSGLGNITVAMANDVTTHEVSADAAVVVSKSVKKNGTVVIEVAQSSEFNEWLTSFTNYLEQAVTARFAEATMVIRNNSTGRTYTCSGVSHQKKADESYQSTSQNRSWTLMCAYIDSN